MLGIINTGPSIANMERSGGDHGLDGAVMEGRPGALEEDERLERRIMELARRHKGGKI